MSFREEIIDKTNKLIESIETNGKEVTSKKIYRFKDGKRLKDFYNYLRRKYNLNKDIENLTEDEKLEIELYKRVEEVIKSIPEIESKEDPSQNIWFNSDNIEQFLIRVEELKNTIKNIKRLPGTKEKENQELYYFTDGYPKRAFFNNLKTKCKNIETKTEFDKTEKILIKSYEEINILLEEVKIERTKDLAIKANEKRNKRIEEYRITIEEKTKELVEVLKKYKKIPLQENKDNIPYSFSDKIKYITFYNHLRWSYHASEKKTTLTEKEKIDKENYKLIEQAKKTTLTEKEKIDIENYKLIEQTIRNIESQAINYEEDIRLTVKYTMTFIETLLRIERLPRKKYRNNDVSEYTFCDGVDQREFYDNLKLHYHKIKNKKEKTSDERILINCTRNIMWHIGYIHLKKYYENYHDLNIVSGYVSKIGDSKIDLRSWLDLQRSNHTIINKGNILIEHEKMLDSICPEWYKTNNEETIKVLKKEKK